MSTVLKLLSWVALALTIVPAVLFLFDSIEMSGLKTLMAAGMLLWFVTAPLVLSKKSP